MAYDERYPFNHGSRNVPKIRRSPTYRHKGRYSRFTGKKGSDYRSTSKTPTSSPRALKRHTVIR